MPRSHPSDDYIRVEAKIYGRNNPAQKLTTHQMEVNNAAIELALSDPNLLLSRQKLLELARTKVKDDGYNFKKGKSRSKQAQSDSPAPKRSKTSETLRAKHITELEEDIKDLDERLKFKEKRRDQATMTRNYKVCDQLTEEMTALKKQRREYVEELRLWKRKQQWYKRKRSLPKSPNSASESDAEQTKRSRSLTPMSPSSSVSGTPIPRSPDSGRSRSVSVSSTPLSPDGVQIRTSQVGVQPPSLVAESAGYRSSDPTPASDLFPSPSSYLNCDEPTLASPLSSSSPSVREIPQSHMVDLTEDTGIPEVCTPASHTPTAILESQQPDLANHAVNPTCGQSSLF